jgi:hypothetical protein
LKSSDQWAIPWKTILFSRVIESIYTLPILYTIPLPAY